MLYDLVTVDKKNNVSVTFIDRIIKNCKLEMITYTHTNIQMISIPEVYSVSENKVK